MEEKKKTTYNAKTIRFGLVECGTAMTATMASTFFAIFLTNVVGLAPAAMGAVISISGIIDTISVPTIGVCVAKMNPRNGKYRTWMLWGGIVCAVFGILRFMNAPGANKIVWYMITYTVTLIGLNAIQSGYSSLLLAIAEDPKERINYSSCAIQCNSLAKFVLGLVAVGLVGAFSKVFPGGNGYLGLAILVSCVVFVTCLQCYKLCKMVDGGRAVKADGTLEEVDESVKISFLDMLKSILSIPMLLFFICGILRIATFFIVNGLAPYYYQYVIGDMKMLTLFLTGSTLLMFIGATFTPYVSKLVKGARNTYICGAIIYGVAMLASFLFKGSAIGITALICIGYIGYAFINSAEKTVYSTVADYAQYKTGKDVKGFLMGLNVFCPKIGHILQGIVLGAGLSMIGFNPENVTPEAIKGFPTLMSLLPAILMAVTAIAMFLFPLTEKRNAEIQAALNERAAAAAADTPEE